MFGKLKLKFWDRMHLSSKQEKARLLTSCAYPSLFRAKSSSGWSVPRGLKLPIKSHLEVAATTSPWKDQRQSRV